MRLIMLAAFAGIALSPQAVAADVSIPGTYRLVSEQRTIVDTNEVIPGTGARGYITYGEDGRVIVLIVRQPRSKPESAEKITDQQRIELFRTITAYAGTYKFDGTTIEHSIEISMNEVWSGNQKLLAMQREVDAIISETLECYDDGAIEEEELAAFGLVLELFNHAIVERRAALQAGTLEAARGAAGGHSLTSRR